MIPIIYDKNETAFVSNGLGRLRDAISCTVTEERNGIYELDLEYPVTGQNFDKIEVGRIIAAEHDETGDVQPFDIVQISKEISGVVTVHCVHISYRQSYLTVTGSKINSLAAAFNLFATAQPSNPFKYDTDKTSTGYFAAADGVPHTVRSMLGGTEGSILDSYGGEFEWDKFNVKLHGARGKERDFTVRYGVNMTEYADETDISNCYSSCIPYWTDGSETVLGDKQTLSSTAPTGRDQCIPLDVSDKFETKPTKTEVNAMGLSVMQGQSPTLPSQNITVSFVRLQDTGEFQRFASLLRCSLCDTIRVELPAYGSSGRFKIVRTVWNVLGERYEEMELGALSVTLSEALGIGAEGVNRETVTTTGTILRAALTDEKNLPSSSWTEVTSIELPSGVWVVTCGVRISANATGRRTYNLTTSSQNTSNDMVIAPASGTVTQSRMAKVIQVAEGASVKYYLNAWQNSGTGLKLSASGLDYGNFITAVRVI